MARPAVRSALRGPAVVLLRLLGHLYGALYGVVVLLMHARKHGLRPTRSRAEAASFEAGEQTKAAKNRGS
ncbi:hypothetical protein CDD83_6330 [Cordyceps sp. RAO-2017]|nr:hypothetical protein CDD83_6330 [Cordyceps sp. RAO-2017]